ncbi:hypothetical protein B566_EDAN004373 [Ephemera danica]|nr:hypothetical protein B566_EDAN004373 [Ephemera danica]
MEEEKQIYHEKQCKELCALHALNNLFQRAGTFQQTQLDAICHSLAPNAWVNPHKSLLGLGNYDVNVLTRALQCHGYEAVWFDKRKDPSCLELRKIFGLIFNVSNEIRLGPLTLPLNKRHWFAIREIQAHYYNLDSKLEKPQLIGNKEELCDYLRQQLSVPDKLLFVVVDENTAEQQAWLRQDTAPSEQSLESVSGGRTCM